MTVFLVPYQMVVPATTEQGVHRLAAITYAVPGVPANDLRLERLRKVPASPRPVAGGRDTAGAGKRVATVRDAVAHADMRAGKLSARSAVTSSMSCAAAAGGSATCSPGTAHPRGLPREPAASTYANAAGPALARVFFATNSARLTPAARATIDRLPADGRYIIVGHADPRPVGVTWSFNYNMLLSMRRALAVLTALAARGAHVSAMAVSWKNAYRQPALYSFDRRASIYASSTAAKNATPAAAPKTSVMVRATPRAES